MVLVQ